MEFQYVKEGIKYLLLPYQVQNVLEDFNITRFESPEIYFKEGKNAFCLTVKADAAYLPFSLRAMTFCEPGSLPNC